MDKITCLHEQHIALGAKMVSFGGFDMPLFYSDIISEHNAVRTEVGVFDVSHMGEIFVKGPEAEKFVQYIFTNDIANAEAGKIFYGMMLQEDGGTVDDLLVYKNGENDFLLVVNAANIDKDFAWISKQAAAFHVEIANESESWGQIAVQGPQGEKAVEEILQLPCKELAFYTFKTLVIDGEEVIISRTGYTGEDGFEIYGSHKFIVESWNKLIAAHITPCGLGCRDTLRFEVGLPLYGDELTEEISPIMCGLGMFVKIDAKDFIGRDACAAQKANGVSRKVVGIELSDKGIPRHGYPVCADGKEIGYVTTGYKSISTGQFVCMALVDIDYAKLDTPVDVLIHGKARRGVVVKKRFYQKNYKK
ncbi:MAG: glycine cleavage system aminomethyltransferase GcvT [Alloprevotella sp.]|nr:glycine cleavage system aminomethyltransferase GcvT [Alloprevotella sp.]